MPREMFHLMFMSGSSVQIVLYTTKTEITVCLPAAVCMHRPVFNQLQRESTMMVMKLLPT